MNNSAFGYKAIIASTCCLLSSVALAQLDGTNGPGVDNTARPAGTYLKFLNYGGRMVQFHRGYLYIMGQGKTTLWDISDVTNPVLLDEQDYGDNGHRWWKLNTDIFWREYSTPEITGSGYHFMDMSNMFDLKPWTNSNVPVPIAEGGQGLQKWQLLETWPTGTNGGNVHDSRYNDPSVNVDAITATFDTNNGAEGSLRFRIGNLLFTTTGSGIAVLDIGDPENIKFLDSISGSGFQQYTTTYHVWKDKIVFLNGTDGNLNGNNMAMVDFSDPTDLKPYTFENGRTGYKTSEMSAGRYMYFQDDFGFAGHTDIAVKINMKTGEIAQTFTAPGWPETYLDYQWMPVGPAVVGTGSNGGAGRTFFYQHQDTPDENGPEIGFHSPSANSTSNPVSTVIGFSIPEMIDERTANDQTIQIRPIGGQSIQGDITWNSYHVLNFIPKQMLLPNTTYEVKLVEGGLKDIAGNGVNEFVYYFSTGSEINTDFAPDVSAITYGSNAPIQAGQNVVLEVTATDDSDAALEYRWDVGQGSTAWSTSNTYSHTFTDAGLYNVTAQVRDNVGNIAGAARNIVVVSDAISGQPTQSGQMALSTTLRTLAVVNPDNGTVSFIDADTLTKQAEYSICDLPNSVTIDQDDNAWVTCSKSDQVKVIRLSNGNSVTSFDFDYGSNPYHVVANPSGDTIYVSLSNKGQIKSFDVSTLAETGTVNIEATVRAMAISSDGSEMMASRFISKEDGKVWNINLSNFMLDTSIVLTNDITTPDTGSDGSGLPNYLASVAFHPDGQSSVVVGKKDNVDRGPFFGTDPLTFETTVRSVMATIDATQNTEQQSSRVDIDNHAQPSAVSFSPYGTHLFVAMQGNNRVVVLNPSDGTEVLQADVGLAPQSILVDQDTNRVFVKNFMGRSVSVLDADALLTSGTRSLPLVTTINTVSSEALSSQVLAGKKVFYNAADTRMALDGYLTCATCHTEGDSDGQVWDFSDRGEGLRNTIALNGRGGMAHGRVHWSANFDEIQDFENDIRSGFNGSGFLSTTDFNATRDPLGAPKSGRSADLDALAAYVSSLTEFGKSPYRSANGTLTTNGAAGKLVFQNAGCGSCHTGASFTDSPQGLMHDVGTISNVNDQRRGIPLQGLDTPTLKDLWNSAPYLHDGAANTLDDVMNIGNGHGFSGLNQTQKRNLIAYLLQIDESETASQGQPIELEFSSIQAGQAVVTDSIPLSISTNIPSITKVEYLADGVLVAESSTPPFDATWLPVQPGTLVLQAKATYANGNTASLSAETPVLFAGSGVCSISYNINQQWSTGFTVEVVITNNSEDSIDGYNLHWNLGIGEQLASGWNSILAQTGQVMHASGAPGTWDGSIAANGGTLTFGFQASKPNNTAAKEVDSFSLNNIPCDVD
ncbi:cellulose binding domain-containing protein [Echinimonas agarilytica]|uniref:Cellulose binding domain-containing protein n=1 Tax=Echinimonas agarilytica TaxID=1215918 RepID=A0AA42B7F2_9GAMM|nr:cellulose binding domain-containing protein [Echinimonas agarilytica]MCM2679208.1 cellulose binding domain-containing protein [Echinimonas agarilytica]